jgi:hypothetical protein
MTSFALHRHPDDRTFSLVLTDDDDSDLSVDESVIYAKPPTDRMTNGWISNVGTDKQSPIDSGGLTPRPRDNETDSFASYSPIPMSTSSGQSLGKPLPRPVNLPQKKTQISGEATETVRCSLTSNCCNLPTVLAVMFLTSASFSVHFPDGAFPSRNLEVGVRGQRPAWDAELRMVLVSALLGAILSSVCLDFFSSHVGPRLWFGYRKKTLVASCSGVTILALFRCLPSVPSFVLVVSAAAAGASAAAVTRLTSVILCQEMKTDDLPLPGVVRYPNVPSSTTFFRQFLPNAIVIAALLGAPTVSAGLGLVLIPPNALDSRTTTDVFQLSPSTVSSAIAVENYSAVADEVSPASNYTTTASVSSMDFLGHFRTVDRRRSRSFAGGRRNAAEMSGNGSLGGNTSVDGLQGLTSFGDQNRSLSSVEPLTISKSASGTMWALMACLFVCSLGALCLALLVVGDFPRAWSADDKAAARQLLLRKPTADDDATNDSDNDSGGNGWHDQLTYLLTLYGFREVLMMAVVAVFVGSQQMFAYFVFVRVIITIVVFIYSLKLSYKETTCIAYIYI